MQMLTLSDTHFPQYPFVNNLENIHTFFVSKELVNHTDTDFLILSYSDTKMEKSQCFYYLSLVPFINSLTYANSKGMITPPTLFREHNLYVSSTTYIRLVPAKITLEQKSMGGNIKLVGN